MIWLLTLGYVAVAALTLSVNAVGRWSLGARIGLVALVTVSYGFTYLGYRALQGWPSPAALPDTFRVQWIAVDEPDKQSGDPGAIYFWLRELDDGAVVGPPRAHELPYDRRVAEAAAEAQSRIQDGETLNGFFTRQLVAPEDPDGDESQDAIGERMRSPTGQSAPLIEFREVPRPTLPPKGAPAAGA